MTDALLAIDPGVAGGGNAWAWFAAGGALHSVGFAKRPDGAAVWAGAPGVIGAPARVVVERPEYQGGRTQGAHAGDLISLAWSGAALAYYVAGHLVCPVIERAPSQWKGSQHKPQMHARLWGALTHKEREILGGAATWATIDRAVEKGALDRWKNPGGSYYPRAFKTHNILDAVALGAIEIARMR